MGLYENIRDVAKVVQQADNLELYRQLLELSSQALEMQAEISRLKEEVNELKKKQDISERVVRHVEPYVTLRDEEPALCYCSHCWDIARQLIQLDCNDYNGTFECPHCHMKGTYDKERRRRAEKAQIDALSSINTRLSGTTETYEEY